jgi:hypothetical protein
VTGLPGNGGTIYVRLYSKLGGANYYNDYTYTSAEIVPSTMVIPLNGATLIGTSNLFSWTNSGADYYRIFVGTTGPGSFNLGFFPSNNPTTETTLTVTGLLGDGKTIYVRLYSNFGGKWYYNDFQYISDP